MNSCIKYNYIFKELLRYNGLPDGVVQVSKNTFINGPKKVSKSYVVFDMIDGKLSPVVKKYKV